MPAIQTYGQVLHADLPHYPDTRPWASRVELEDAAHIILHEPIYVCPRGDLWISRPDADPLTAVLARAADETEHVLRERPLYVVWSIDRRGNWQPSLVLQKSPGHFVLTSLAGTQALPVHRRYRWRSAVTWEDDAQTRLIVPADDGISILTLGPELTEAYMPLAEQSAASRPAAPQARFVFDLRGILAWIPPDRGSVVPGRVARFVDGGWQRLPASDWPDGIIHLVPLLDGSVLQIRSAQPPPTVQLSVVPLDASQLDESRIEPIVEQLSDDDPEKRRAAYEHLTQFGPGVFPILQKLSADASPQAQASIDELLAGRLQVTLGGMRINDDQLALFARLSDGGAVFSAPEGVSIPQPDETASIIKPDYLSVRPGRPVQQLPSPMFERLQGGATIAAWGDEWIVTDADKGPCRFLPPSEFTPLLRSTERQYRNFYAIDGRGRWYFRSDDAGGPTLVIDPTVPDPSPRLAVWLIGGNVVGWDQRGWPALTDAHGSWIVSDHDWERLPRTDRLMTELPEPAKDLSAGGGKAATSPSTEPFEKPTGDMLCRDAAGDRIYGDGSRFTLQSPSGHIRSWTLPASLMTDAGGRTWLVDDGHGELLLLNGPQRIVRIRVTRGDQQPFSLEGIFELTDQDLTDVHRMWLDPAGRVDIACSGGRLAVIFPTGQIPSEIEDRILADDLHRLDPSKLP